MTIENDHVLLVNDESKSYQIKYEKIKTDISSSVTDNLNAVPEANQDGKQYGRQDGDWTEIVHTPEYTDADVNDLLNTTNASAGKVLSYTGGDYEWVTKSEGGGGDVDLTYTHPSGSQRTIQNRLEDYTSVKDFGALGNGTKDDTDAINACIDWVGQQGGGMVYFPPGTYLVELKGQKASGTTTWHNCAIKVNYDNVHLVGAGQGATIIKSIANSFTGQFDYTDPQNPVWSDDSYGLIEVIKYPFGNAVTEDGTKQGTKVEGGSISNMTLNNNIDDNNIMSGGCISLKYTQNYTIQNVSVKNVPFYGIGMQNGGFKNVTLNNVLLQNISRDGVDLKDNGNISEGNQFNNITCRNVCRGELNKDQIPDSNGNDPNEFSSMACLDLQGYGLQLNNIVVDGITNTQAGAAIRIKQAGKEGKRGNSGRTAAINNVFVTTGVTIKHGIQVKAGNVSISNLKLRGMFEIGVSFEQENCSLINSFISNATIGVSIEDRSGTNDTEYPDGVGGDFAMITNNAIKNTSTCVRLKRPHCNISNNVFHQSDIGIDANDGDVTDAVISNNVFDDSVSNKISVNGNKRLCRLNNINDWAPRITVTQYDSDSVGSDILALTASDGDEQIQINSQGIGFYGQRPIAKQTITGNVATDLDDVMKDLLNELEQIGLINNSTTNTPGPGVTPGPFDPYGMIRTDGDGIGFYGKTPVTKQSAKGKITDGSLLQTQNALKSLVETLEATGLIRNETT